LARNPHHKARCAQSDTSLLVAPYAVTPIDDCRIVAVSMTRLLNLAPAEWVPTTAKCLCIHLVPPARAMQGVFWDNRA